MDLDTLRELVREKVWQENSYDDLSSWLSDFIDGKDEGVTARRVFILLEFIGYECVPKWKGRP